MLARLLDVPRISLGFIAIVALHWLAMTGLFLGSDMFVLHGGLIEAARRSLIYAFGLALIAALPAALLLAWLGREQAWHFILGVAVAYAVVTVLLFLGLGKPGEVLAQGALLRIAAMLGFGAICGALFWLVAYARR